MNDSCLRIPCLPFLAKFSVFEGASLSKLFLYLDFSSLNLLEFHTAIRPKAASTTGFLSLLIRSTSVIEHLITDAEFFKRGDFIKCLRLCPFLKSLSIRRSQRQALSRRRGSKWIFPLVALLNVFTSSSSLGNDNSNNHADDTDLEDRANRLFPNLKDFEVSSQTAIFRSLSSPIHQIEKR